MPYNDPDATDPMTLHGVELETDDPATIREMALCFVEEYVRLGHGAGSIFELFTAGTFAGPTLALRHLGPDAIRAMIDEQTDLWGPRVAHRFSGGGRLTVDVTAVGLSLPVLNA